MKAWLRRIALVISGVVLALTAVETALRIWGFRFDPTPIVQFGWPEPFQIGKRYLVDPDLFWVPPHYDDLLRQARESHPTIAFLGDSCTEFGHYPEKTLAVLKVREPSLANGMAFGVGGWSSEQGRKQLERDILPLGPRVVTVYFGWNDHWVALGPRDKDVSRIMVMTRLSSNLRIVQLYLKFAFARFRPLSSRPNRVSIKRYRSNLEEIVRLSRAAGVQTVLITAPTLMRPGNMPAGSAKRFARSLDEVPVLHQRYLEVTRSVAREAGATLCDLAQAFEAAPESPSYFRADMIHLTDAGDQAIADILAGCILKAAESSANDGGRPRVAEQRG